MRKTILFHSDWKFHLKDEAGAQMNAFDDQEWRTLSLPHDWSIEGPYSEQWASATGYLPGGVGWYRKMFLLPDIFVGRQVALHFDGIYCNSDVWINEHHLGHRPSGFIGFRYDLTPYLRPDGKNTVAVRVDHRRFADARWYTGSGINRNVFLVATDPIHIRLWGVSVTTPVVTADAAEVDSEVVVQNQTDTEAEVRVEQILLDTGGSVVATAGETATVAAQGEQTVAGRMRVLQPRRWSVEHPLLYTLRTMILRGGRVIDQEDTVIGIRTVRFDSNHGFFLNEQNMKLKGVCLHDDAGALGTAVPVKVWERRLRILKTAGVNAIRMAHNPHMPELYDLCDRMGFLVQDEAFDEWEGGKNKWIGGWNVGQPGRDGYHAYFGAWAEADLRDMILRDRNHPSIIMWSIGNEIDYPNDPYTHEVLDIQSNPQSYGQGQQADKPHAGRLGEVARRLAEVVQTYDTTRPVTAGLAAAIISNAVGFADALDVAGYNYQESRYAEDHIRYPERVLYGSENGMAWSAWQAVSDNPFICGQFLWTGIDYLGEARSWPIRSSGSGLLDLAGFPKPEYHFRRSLWTETPMISIGTSDVPPGDESSSLWRRHTAEPVWDGVPGELVRVHCFTNCAQAELILNGRSLGTKDLAGAEGRVIWWDVPYTSGTLTGHGLVDGIVVATHELKTSGPAKALRAEADTDALTADGLDMAHVIVTVVDVDGRLVYSADHEVTWTIEGPARLLGLESGDHASHEDYKAPTRRVFHGRQLGYLQATEEPGPVTVRLTAPGLTEATVTLRTGRSPH